MEKMSGTVSQLKRSSNAAVKKMDDPPVASLAVAPTVTIKKRMPPSAPKAETKTESDMMKDRLNASLEASASMASYSER